jgi:hypothetical protein
MFLKKVSICVTTSGKSLAVRPVKVEIFYIQWLNKKKKLFRGEKSVTECMVKI